MTFIKEVPWQSKIVLKNSKKNLNVNSADATINF